MFKCAALLLLAVLGSSTCYRFPSDPAYLSHGPSQWNAGHNGPHGSHSASWHHGYHDGIGKANAGGGGIHHRQWPQPSHSVSHYDQTGSYAHDDDSDDQSDTDSDEETDQDGVDSSGTDDQVKNPYRFNNQGSDANLQQGQPDGSGKNKDGSLFSHIADQASKPIDYNIQESIVNCKNDTLEPEVMGQSDITDQIAYTNPKPFEFKNENNRNRGDMPEIDIKKGQSNDNKPTKCKNQTGNPVANLTNGTKEKPLQSNRTGESNETYSEAYITGPDNTLYDLRANRTVTNDTKSQKDVPNLGISTSVHNTPVKGAVIATVKNERPSVFYPTTPAPSIGSIPVPVLSQFLAPSLQWHVGIYTKMETPYSQICGGSLVKTDVVLTAAHCFWSADGGALRPALFAAAAGKLQRTWEAVSDAFAQHSDIREIHIPPRFQGAMTSFQDDIAVARLTTPFEYGPGVKPVCLDFDPGLEREHLQSRRKGTIVGWGLTTPNGPPSERLNFLELPYLEIEQCIKRVHPTFLKYITSDKICAGDFRSGLAACKGDSGGGLVYTSNSIPYLRGIVSTAPRDANQCNAFTPATFTQITAHMTFLADHIPNIDEDCRSIYDEVGNKTVGMDNRNVENGGSSAEAGETRQLTLNVTVQNADRKLDGPVPLPLSTSSRQQYDCQCTCN